MSVERNKALALKTYELLDARRFDEVRGVGARDLVDHDPLVPGQGPGLDGLMEVVELFARAFPDFRHVIEDQVAEGDKVVTRFRWSGTHLGSFGEIPATGRRVEVRGIEIYRIVDGKITEIWRLEDELGMMRQLGLLPEGDRAEEGAGRV